MRFGRPIVLIQAGACFSLLGAAPSQGASLEDVAQNLRTTAESVTIRNRPSKTLLSSDAG